MAAVDPMAMAGGIIKEAIVLDDPGMPPVGSIYGNPVVVYAPIKVGSHASHRALHSGVSSLHSALAA